MSNVDDIIQVIKEELRGDPAMIAEYMEMLNTRVLDTPQVGNPDGHVYFIQNRDTKNIKIGAAIDPKARMKTLEIGSDAELLLLASIPVEDYIRIEKRFHAAYAQWRKMGEWFYPSDPILDLVEAAQDGDVEKVFQMVSARLGEELAPPQRRKAYVMG